MEMPLHVLLKGGSWQPVNIIEHKVTLGKFIGPEDLLMEDQLLRLFLLIWAKS